ncbi:hypothetical protein BB559_002284 [Furculomyces boomerangus]|uniref:Major facilitator superfamily (MFS) profile domain-containing protein n=1 Tax=Furculomyces boomerangus TaxID=61424 RepID=A0A2T9YWM7_9FUNG|nr:hypothetical protein BB559_002284 [Furculomyces boomerangus]
MNATSRRLLKSRNQTILIGLICFAIPGMYNALNTMGGGGQVDPSAASKANTALYATFAIFGLFGGGIINLFSLRIPLFLSGLTYVLYTGSYIYYNATFKPFFTIFSGQGMMVTSYPLEKEKGHFISIFWIIFSLGGVIGSIIPLAVGLGDKPLPNSGYAAFMIIQTIGSFMCLALIPPHKVIRSDNTNVIVESKQNTLNEIVEVLKLFKNKHMIYFSLIGFTSNFFYSYIFNHYNLPNFSADSRGFNNLIYYISGIIGSYLIGFLLDFKTSRKRKAYISSIGIWCLFNIMWALTYIQQRKMKTRRENINFNFFNYKTSGVSYIWPCMIFAIFGLLDAFYQNYVYWIIGSFSNNSNILSRYIGFCKFLQAIGACISWAIDAGGMEPNTQLFINWGMIVLTLPGMIMLSKNTKESSEPSLSSEKDVECD